MPDYIREVVELVAFLARDDKRIDKRSGVSQRLPIAALESVVSSAEQRAVRNREARSSARIADVYAALPAITGKMELEYEGELRGAENIARELIRGAVGKVFTSRMEGANLQPVVQWFELGGELKVPENAPAAEALAQLKKIQGLMEQRRAHGSRRAQRPGRNGRRGGIYSGRPLGAQAHQPQRRARLSRGTPQGARSARTAASVRRGASSIERAVARLLRDEG